MLYRDLFQALMNDREDHCGFKRPADTKLSSWAALLEGYKSLVYLASGRSVDRG